MPLRDESRILMAHGGGGRRMQQLIEQVFVAAFDNPMLAAGHDGAVFQPPQHARLALSTDSYVVRPLSFPGGDIGKLAVYGTVNDLAMCGARALYLTAGFILEEGLLIEDLKRVVASMGAAAKEAGVAIVTGDTKVVERGKGDQVFINTAGVGVLAEGVDIRPQRVEPTDAILVSGDLGRHGIAILAAREGLAFETSIVSDCAPLVAPVMALLDAGIRPTCLRDLTRGGLASALVEIAEAADVACEIEERSLIVHQDVRAACEILGFDPLALANEGRFVTYVPAQQAEAALRILQSFEPSAAQIGRVTERGTGTVTMKTLYGASRRIDMLSGEQLPRIC
jgi:hydrogenase expression/formation protein HypE